ncbi:FlhC family transcriptional regulator [Methylomonas sp.]|uniref:FlhC family transcriptional regulator n=1 Tax=Methylomonas sp. TaxID=418 RepID=UPI0025D50322|nr:FlhC family transcriptional regulator [Methylomonas sp.]
MAITLIQRQARIAVIVRETTIPRELIKATYKDILGRSGSSGPIKESIRGLTHNMKQYKEATLFAKIFRAIEAENIHGDIHNVIQAFDFFKISLPSGSLDFTTAWLVARDLRNKKLQLRECGHCYAAVLIILGCEKPLERCCVCKTALKTDL